MSVSSANISMVLLNYVNPHVSNGSVKCIEINTNVDKPGKTVVKVKLTGSYPGGISAIQEKLRDRLNNGTLIVEHV
tara:strand:- start:5335 stop:5562 length:228 start_codon:yes stop_codon:yes gene_type:complete